MFDLFMWMLVFLAVGAFLFLFIAEAATIFLSEKSGDRLRTARSDDRHHKAPTTT